MPRWQESIVFPVWGQEALASSQHSTLSSENMPAAEPSGGRSGKRTCSCLLGPHAKSLSTGISLGEGTRTEIPESTLTHDVIGREGSASEGSGGA